MYCSSLELASNFAAAQDFIELKFKPNKQRERKRMKQWKGEKHLPFASVNSAKSINDQFFLQKPIIFNLLGYCQWDCNNNRL